MAESRDDLIYLARLAEQAERYDEMSQNMKKVALMNDELLLKSVIFSLLPTRTSSDLDEHPSESSHPLNKKKTAEEKKTTSKRPDNTERKSRLN